MFGGFENVLRDVASAPSLHIVFTDAIYMISDVPGIGVYTPVCMSAWP